MENDKNQLFQMVSAGSVVSHLGYSKGLWFFLRSTNTFKVFRNKMV